MQPAIPATPAIPACPSTPEAEAFVRFCYQRRRVGWPELYDEMCHVATRGLFRGMGTDALAEVGVGFSLFETPRLAALVAPDRRRGAGGATGGPGGGARGGGPVGRGGAASWCWRSRAGAGSGRGPAAPDRRQARIRRRAISPSIWRSAST